MATPAQNPAQTRKCVACGRDIQWDANVCPYCGKDYRQTMAPGPPMMPMMMAPPKPKTALPMVAGLLLIVVGIIWIIEAVATILAALSIDFLGDTFGFGGLVGGLADFLAGVIIVVGLIGLILALVVLFGGISSVQRKHAGLALIGAIFGLAAFGPYFIASILSFVALILLAVSHHEFD